MENFLLYSFVSWLVIIAGIILTAFIFGIAIDIFAILKTRNALKPVVALQDQTGNWYIIPKELEMDFNEMVYSTNSNKTDIFDFVTTFGKYKLGKDISKAPLYAKIK
jgi:hypothetical protein